MKLQSIELIFNYEEDEPIIIKGLMTPQGWEQWGQPSPLLAENVSILQALYRTLQSLEYDKCGFYQDDPEEG